MYDPKTKRFRTKGGDILNPRVSVSGLANTGWWKELEKSSCEVLLNLGALSVGFRLADQVACKEVGKAHCMHQFTFDKTQTQCCHCELVIPQLDYVELFDEGLVE